MQSMVMLEGSLIVMPQGELQGALSSLQTMCNVLAPTMWSSLYEWDVQRDSPGKIFYSSLAAMQVVRLIMSRLCTNDSTSSNASKQQFHELVRNVAHRSTCLQFCSQNVNVTAA